VNSSQDKAQSIMAVLLMQHQGRQNRYDNHEPEKYNHWVYGFSEWRAYLNKLGIFCGGIYNKNPLVVAI
jgi:hypothetical protein